MEGIFSIALILLAFLFYFSNRGSLINRWCAFYLATASIGVIKEAFLYQAIPWVQSVWGDVIREDIYLAVYSVLTWISYSFAVPILFVAGLYFYGLNNTNPKALSVIKAAIFIPAAVLSFVYAPIHFRTYQLGDPMFWTVYSAYNLGLGIAVIGLILKGIRIEKSAEMKRQKVLFSVIVLPASIYALISIFVVHSLGLERWFKAWQWNVVIVCINLVIFVVMAFKNGFLGLKLSAQIYDWDSNMDLIGKGADYTNHMLKNQTSKMELCIEQLKQQFAAGDDQELPEEIAILSRSISALKYYIDRMKRHSQTIRLLEEPCSLAEMLEEAMPASLAGNNRITVLDRVGKHVFWVCDRIHMTEVFTNILTNAAEAIRGSGSVAISGTFEKSHYLLRITDTGAGMNDDELRNMFAPYFTTKSTEKNFGLGLSYCKNVLAKHGGGLSAESKPGEGTAVTVAFPAKRVAISGDKGGDTDV